jgi:rhodanese-related sulfurtransferase
MALFKEIDSKDLNTLMSSQLIHLIDVRSDEEVARGRISGARHIPLHLLPILFHELEGEHPIVFYCHSGIRSAQACSFMAQQGRENFFNLRCGVLGWSAAGFQLETNR